MKKGSFLIFSLGIFLFLTLLCLGLGFRTFLSVRKTNFFLNRARALQLAISGLKRAKNILKEDNGSVDHLKEDWAERIREEVSFSSPKKEGILSVQIEDESSRLNINKINVPIFKKLFEEVEIEGSEEKINYILDYIDADSLPRSFKSEDEVKNEELKIVEELLLIKNISKENYNKLKGFIATAANKDGRVNINTANQELINILIGAEELRDEVFKLRFGPNLIAGDEDDGYYGEGGGALPSELEGIFKTTSDYFRLISKAEVEGATEVISCVINRDSGEVVYWHEE